MKSKTIKISYSTRFQKHSTLTVPKIQLEGKWLEELGFSIGSTIKVEYENNSIRIRPLTADEISAAQQHLLHSELKRKKAEFDLLQKQCLHLSQVSDTSVHYKTPTDK